MKEVVWSSAVIAAEVGARASDGGDKPPCRGSVMDGKLRLLWTGGNTACNSHGVQRLCNIGACANSKTGLREAQFPGHVCPGTGNAWGAHDPHLLGTDHACAPVFPVFAGPQAQVICEPQPSPRACKHAELNMLARPRMLTPVGKYCLMYCASPPILRRVLICHVADSTWTRQHGYRYRLYSHLGVSRAVSGAPTSDHCKVAILQPIQTIARQPGGTCAEDSAVHDVSTEPYGHVATDTTVVLICVDLAPAHSESRALPPSKLYMRLYSSGTQHAAIDDRSAKGRTLRICAQLFTHSTSSQTPRCA